jgi:sensor domain CHASE-containing protein
MGGGNAAPVHGAKRDAVTVRGKIFVILGLTAAAMLGALYLAADYVILNRFIALERLNTQQTMNVVREGVDDDLAELDRSNSDLSVYDGTWEVMAAGNAEKINDFIHALLADSKGGWQAQQMINYVIFTNAAGHVVWATGYDAARDGPRAVPADLLAHVRAGDALLNFRTTRDKVGGVMLLRDGPLLIVSRPIVKTNQEGPIEGALVTARRLDDRTMARISEKTHETLSVYPFLADDAPDDVEDARRHLFASGSAYVRYIKRKADRRLHHAEGCVRTAGGGVARRYPSSDLRRRTKKPTVFRRVDGADRVVRSDRNGLAAVEVGELAAGGVEHERGGDRGEQQRGGTRDVQREGRDQLAGRRNQLHAGFDPDISGSAAEGGRGAPEGTAGGETCGRRGEPREGRISGDDEPRDPHADERRDRHE